ncbi:MAG: M20 aminoacylase family protein [Mesorhizobium sp.]|nr:M20 aminoacylase family protein [Mesorhizobium sp.]
MTIPIRSSELDASELAMLVTLRRDLHKHPELGFEERRTAGIVAEALRAAGIEVHDGLGRTGVVGTLRNGDGKRRIGLRADMDALAMAEMAAERGHRSSVDGRMHACGHDGHTAMLLGAALRLARSRDFSGTVHFIFQPAEEGRGGAKAMIDDGFFELFPLDAIYGLHNMPGLDPDQIAVVEGPRLASSDRWEASFRGRGTHGGKPHLGSDAVTAAGSFLVALHGIVARRVDPMQPAVVSACAISGGDFEALNVIPDTVRVGGTARAYSADVRDLLEREIGAIAQGVAAMHGLTSETAYVRHMPAVTNHPAPTRVALGAARAATLPDRVLTDFPPSMAGDDFAFFSERVPGAYVWLGNGPAEDGAMHHGSRYDFNDAAIPTGVAYWTEVARRELQ